MFRMNFKKRTVVATAEKRDWIGFCPDVGQYVKRKGFWSMQFGESHLIWLISVLAMLGIVWNPLRRSEWIYAVIGAVLLLALRLLTVHEFWQGIAAGTDVYLFLAGMMMLAELARQEGLFRFLASKSIRWANGSPQRLYLLIFLTGVLVTVFLSNDATAVVLTPAVAAVVVAAEVSDPLPYLLICAFVANAASFVLPISNPANLVVFGKDLPPLFEWIQRFTMPSILAVVSTYFLLRWTQRRRIHKESIADRVAVLSLSKGGRIAALGIVSGVVTLLLISANGWDLGWPTMLIGLLTVLAVSVGERARRWSVLRNVFCHISWGTLVLVAGLFVIAQALERTDPTQALTRLLAQYASGSPRVAPLSIGFFTGVLTNLTNNLPLGLVVKETVNQAQFSKRMIDGLLIGIDLGPNLSITGSLATLLWLSALRREGIQFSGLRFFKLGLLIMPVSCFLAIAWRVCV